ncbi:hypothetical protein AC578_5403 [Pseudocercospora eumusae]|uniref:Uncharacterized protein n=1 Tax=Pseudocercospora eumusae TaxID=321146 RepID=A0A139HJV4_9PEZI|nr:hypothetical protein AC578_5403 [Pseudocercospora eumusae]
MRILKEAQQRARSNSKERSRPKTLPTDTRHRIQYVTESRDPGPVLQYHHFNNGKFGSFVTSKSPSIYTETSFDTFRNAHGLRTVLHLAAFTLRFTTIARVVGSAEIDASLQQQVQDSLPRSVG